MSRILGDEWLTPGIDQTNEAFFKSGQVHAQGCNDCGAFQHPPEVVCGSCQGTNLSLKPCSGEGTIESVTVVHHPVHPRLADQCPYTIAVVSVDGAPGVNVIGNVLNREPGEVAIGQRVRAAFEEVTDPETGDTLKIPQWEVV